VFFIVAVVVNVVAAAIASLLLLVAKVAAGGCMCGLFRRSLMIGVMYTGRAILAIIVDVVVVVVVRVKFDSRCVDWQWHSLVGQ